MGVVKSVHLKNVTSVAPYDAAKPQMLKFKAGHKEYEFNCESQRRTRLLASRGRALGRLEQPRRRRAPDALIGLRTQARASTSARYWPWGCGRPPRASRNIRVWSGKEAYYVWRCRRSP